MRKINIQLTDSNVAKSNDELYRLLRENSKSTSLFQELIDIFLSDFNKKYDTDVSFSQVLDIYNNQSSLNPEKSIILCKALLEFIQNNWIEVTFKWKTYLLRYNTLASTNVALEHNPLFVDEMAILQSLSLSISSFIDEVKRYFRFLIPDGTALSDANVDNEFWKIPGMKREEKEVELATWEKAKTSPWSIQIASNFVINCEISDDDLKLKITKFTNEQLQQFLNYVYERILNHTGKKHIDLAKYLFSSYDQAAWQAMKKVFESWSKFRMATMNKISIRKLRKLLFSDIVDLPQQELTQPIGHNASTQNENESQDFSAYMKDDTLYISESVTINLSDDKTFQSSLTSLSRENSQEFFWLLEDIVIRKYDITQRYSAAKIHELIRISDDSKVETNVRQKVTSSRTKASTITNKFLNNNINISNLRKLILEDGEYLNRLKIESDTSEKGDSDISDSIETNVNTFKFEFSWDNEKDRSSLNVEFVQGKNLEKFLIALNSLMLEEAKIQGVEELFTPYLIEDLRGTVLNSVFFDSLRKGEDKKDAISIFDLFTDEELESFLYQWHKVVWKKMKVSKTIDIKPWSKEELLDFVFQVWQKIVDKKVNKEARKSNWSKFHRVTEARKKTRMTNDMFEWISSLTPDLVDQVDIRIFDPIFSKGGKREIKRLIQEYLDNREAA